MKFQNLKLEKERERNLRSKNDKVLRRKREYLWHGGLRTALTMGYDCLRVTTFVTMGYNFASALGYDCLRVSEWVSEFKRVERKGVHVSVFEL